MDPVLAEVESKMKAVIQNLYNLIVQGVDHQGPATQEAMKQEITRLVENLLSLSQSAPSVRFDIPPEVTEYVERARNPKIYTRELVEATQRMNQLLKGRCDAYAQMRDILAKDIVLAMPELENDVRKVVRSTGGSIDG
ncbi:mediator of RNA polymerase II transcription subunit 10 [Clohesyomyces aquaticus]|uniref:Mediator of RNA polymerase II transcription subunit 10 n=1 Tax=Clohesyomyces aquaticus TaxID=1231657 RepID=A0A1Y1ZXA4_9PLEO|nr:mediator of RNA polymerase II transcription subunit 10 [Clohesyomyces aquaticus]